MPRGRRYSRAAVVKKLLISAHAHGPCLPPPSGVVGRPQRRGLGRQHLREYRGVKVHVREGVAHEDLGLLSWHPAELGCTAAPQHTRQRPQLLQPLEEEGRLSQQEEKPQ